MDHHPENRPIEERFIAQALSFTSKCFVLAKQILEENSITGEALHGALPLLALDIQNRMSYLANVLNGANQKNLDEIYDGLDSILKAIDRKIAREKA
jgi:hypothetical protein